MKQDFYKNLQAEAQTQLAADEKCSGRYTLYRTACFFALIFALFRCLMDGLVFVIKANVFGAHPNIEDYRKTYYELLDEQGWNDQVITISYKDWNPDGYKDKRNLYDGGLMHLNAKGYLVLDICIVHKIIEKLSVSSDNGNH